jgi:prolipoprotein diacylglyceryl transferase
VAVLAVPAGLVGARLYHVVTDWNRLYADDPWRALEIWNGGLGIPGGVLAGVLVGIVVARRTVPSWRRLADAVAPGIPLAQAIGRLGNYFNQELYGRPSDLPWALEVDLAYRPTDPEYAGVSTYHPTFLYEGLWNVGLFGLIMWGGTRFVLRPGRWFAVYVTGYGLGRLWVEALRIDTASLVFGVRVNIWMAVVIALGGLLWLFWGGSPVDREATERLRAGVEPRVIFAAETAQPDEEAGDGAADDEAADDTPEDDEAADDTPEDDVPGEEPAGSGEGVEGGGADAVGERGPRPD